ITVTQTPAAGTMVGIGPHTIHLEANDHASSPGPDGIPDTADDGTGNVTTKDITFTVKDTTAPTIHCPASITTDTEPGTCAAHVNPGTATATDNCDSNPTITGTRSDGRPLTDTYPKGTTTITWTASDHASPANQSSCAQTITVQDHENPVIICPAPIVQGNDPGTCSATVNPGQPTATDNCDNPTLTSSRSDGQGMNAPYPKGTTTITWTATDSSGNHSSCTQTVTVVDNEAPTFTIAATQTMWPPNHKYQNFLMTSFVTSVHDNCDGTIPVSNVVITKVTSDEIENGNGDGNTTNDIVIAANCKSVQLRSEREGNSNGRVYTIFFSVTDAAGNKGTGTAKVVVPHNPGETAVDSGPHYTVTSNCP
ncbi:MAG TPA: HYR domain-containing protein, partial [Pyrinomonadaceae bacterium]|nr:HYR domain-containing protein [Pyrinomonadaceae bacterium]